MTTPQPKPNSLAEVIAYALAKGVEAVQASVVTQQISMSLRYSAGLSGADTEEDFYSR